ncbi:hypothetical protein FB446DRAFT_772629 [Lentinula raphanica]|nr:hypothetical protein FB446DRAFT_772629 [Lentinula raphanica]
MTITQLEERSGTVSTLAIRTIHVNIHIRGIEIARLKVLFAAILARSEEGTSPSVMEMMDRQVFGPCLSRFSGNDGGVGDGDPDPATLLPPPATALPNFLSLYFSRPAYQDTAPVAAFFENFPNGIFALGSFNPSVKWPIICNGRILTHQIAQLSQMLRPRLRTISKWSFKAARPSSSSKHPRLELYLSQALGLEAGLLSSLGFLNPTVLFDCDQRSAGSPISLQAMPPGVADLLIVLTYFFFWGFNLKATVGWYPVTGLGTPDVGKMNSLVTAVY